jgi:hypothetical protein
LENIMKTLALAFSALILIAQPAVARSGGSAGNFTTLAQADIRVGADGITIDRDRDRERDRERAREHAGERREEGRDCKTVTVEENGVTRTTRKCD